MPMLAHFEEWPAQDRRRATRRSLMLGAEGGGSPVTIQDLSLTGVLLETSTPMLVGASFDVDLPQAGTVEAIVVWNSGEFYGCQFSQPISPAALSAALLQSVPNAAPNGTARRDPLTELRELNDEVERLAMRMDSALRRLSKD